VWWDFLTAKLLQTTAECTLKNFNKTVNV